MRSLFQHNRALAFGRARRNGRVQLGFQLGRWKTVLSYPERWQRTWGGEGWLLELRYRAGLWVFGLSWGRGSLLILFGPLAVRLSRAP